MENLVQPGLPIQVLGASHLVQIVNLSRFRFLKTIAQFEKQAWMGPTQRFSCMREWNFDCSRSDGATAQAGNLITRSSLNRNFSN